MGWKWATATPAERAKAVRRHMDVPGLRFSDLCRLFNLTAEGAWQIMKGDNWRPEYDMDAERERRLELIRQAIRGE